MTATRQYVAVKFDPMKEATYTYHNDGRELFVGDRVNVEIRGKTKAVTVAKVGVPKPDKFETKPVIGRVEDAPEAKADAAIGIR